ncbi:protein of unknown function [Sterolibacterium denitrificans]|uniref:Uncharacterized protein n=1 Tax=Sterolibacterium denitrificans TaxID=157592 RepID=A0A7Z7HSU3_9PROT|nr:protein of unknown function [Sterolibacterium denitrificans]
MGYLDAAPSSLDEVIMSLTDPYFLAAFLSVVGAAWIIFR